MVLSPNIYDEAQVGLPKADPPEKTNGHFWLKSCIELAKAQGKRIGQ
jgi:hypothetical protein